MALMMRSSVASRIGATQTRSCTSRLALSPVQVRRSVCVRVETERSTDSSTSQVDPDQLLKDVKTAWDKIENKPQVALYAGGGLFAIWLTSSVIGAINAVPLLPKLLELVGLGYSAWFTYRYLLFQSSRKELLADVEELKKKVTGDQ